jgi:nitrate reductase NapD
MNLSGIVVVSAPGRFDECLAAAAALPGVEVHHRDPSTHRFIVVQEADTIEAEMDALLRLKAVPGVVLAEMVYHYFPEGEPQ